MLLKNTNIIQLTFHLFGIAASYSSTQGTYNFLFSLFQGDEIMALTAALLMSVLIYAGWYTLFNKKGLSKKITAFFIALIFSALSVYTIYQQAQKPLVNQINLYKKAEYERALSEVKNHNNEVEKQRALLQQSIKNLQSQNKDDQASLKAAQTIVTESKFKKKRADALELSTDLRVAIANRNLQISTISTQILSIKKQTLPKKPTIKNSAAFDAIALMRAGIYDVAAMLLILMSGWFRPTKQEEQDIAPCTNVQEQSPNVPTTEGTAGYIEQGTTQKNKITPKKSEKKQQKNENLNKGIELIRAQSIEPNNNETITLDAIQKTLGVGRKIAEAVRNESYQLGLLERSQHGKGYAYHYPKNQPQAGNIINLAPRVANEKRG